MSPGTEPVLTVSGLSVAYLTPSGPVTAVSDVCFALHRGRVCGVAGESGSGKSTAALAAIGWNTPVQRRLSGSSFLNGTDLFACPPKELRHVWGRGIGYVPQEIGGSLHPAFRIRAQFRETLKVTRQLGRQAADDRAVELLRSARVPDPERALRRYAHEFSGGQLQRIAIALALAPHPDVMILDEPTTGLDVTTQQALITVLRELVTEQQVAALFISHDLALLSQFTDDLVIMYAGEVVESGPTAAILARPRHPYTRALLDAAPSLDAATMPRGIPGRPPGHVVSDQCGFADRCAHRHDRCLTSRPALTPQPPAGLARCLRAAELNLVRRALPGRPATPEAGHGGHLLEVRNITCRYRTDREQVTAVSGVSLTVPRGGVLALVGESGSGKTTVGQSIAGAVRPSSGEILLDGTVLPGDPRQRTSQQRRAIQLIFQDATASLNPRRTVGDQLRHIARHFRPGDGAAQREAIAETLDAVQLSAALLDRFPRQVSGGQRQRVAIACAFIARPELVICDEITSGQDVSVQAAILTTLSDLQRRFRTSVLFISHDLSVVRSIADQVAVMRHGRIVESGPAEEVFSRPTDDYTAALLSAAPRLGPKTAASPGDLMETR